MGRRPREPPATPAAFQKQFKKFNQKPGKGLESPVRLGLEVKIEPKYFSVKGKTFFFQLLVINHANYFSNFFLSALPRHIGSRTFMSGPGFQ